MRHISIRRFTGQGSTVTDYVLSEAEAVVAEALKAGGLVVDEVRQERIERITEETEKVLILPQIAGG